MTDSDDRRAFSAGGPGPAPSFASAAAPPASSAPAASAAANHASSQSQPAAAASPPEPAAGRSPGTYDPRANVPAGARTIPFIRPADIYKRLEEARELERRASIDSANSGADDKGVSPPPVEKPMEKPHDVRAARSPLASVPERKSEYGIQEVPGLAAAPIKTEAPATIAPLELPKVGEESTFGQDFWTSAPRHEPTPQPAVGNAQAIPALVVKAFHNAEHAKRTDSSQATAAEISPILKPVAEPMASRTPARSGADATESQAAKADHPFSGAVELKPSSESGSRPGSPSKGRVRDLATQFDGPSSRRNSTISTSSMKSEDRAAESAMAHESTARPLEVRPTNENRPTSPHEAAKSPSLDKELPPRPVSMAALAPSSAPGLAPTTSKYVLEGKENSRPAGPLGALAAVGSAMHDAVRTAVKDNKEDPVPLPKPALHDRAPHDTLQFASAIPTVDAADVPPPVPLKPGEPSHPNAPEATAAAEAAKFKPPLNFVNQPAAVPRLNKRFSWESSASSLHEVPGPKAPQLSMVMSTGEAATPSSITSPGNSRLAGDGLHIMNAQPGELPPAASDPVLNRPSTPKLPSNELSTTTDARFIPDAVAALGGGLIAAESHDTALPEYRNQELREPEVREPEPSEPRLPDPEPQGPGVRERSATRDESGRPGLPSFREVQSIKSATQRIATFDSTRTNWAAMDSGLDAWLSQTLEKYPEHSNLKQDPGMSAAPHLGGNLSTPVQSRHAKSGSMGKILGAGGQGSGEGMGQSEFAPSDKRTSGSGKVGETLKGLGGKGKGLLERMGGRLRGGPNEGVGT